MHRRSSRLETLLLCATLLAITPALATECDDPLDIGRGEVAFHVPSSYDPSLPTPLLIMLHGYAVTASFEISSSNIFSPASAAAARSA